MVHFARSSPYLPTVPTLAEAGVPGFDFTLWVGVFAPAGTQRRSWKKSPAT